MARPTDYTPELLEKARRYVSLQEGSDFGWVEAGELFPSIVGLALYLDISRETCHTWAKDKEKPEFSDIYEKVMAYQERALTTGGITNQYNSTITKLMLTKHGYTDRTDVTTAGKELPTPLMTLDELRKDNSHTEDSEPK